MTVIADTSPLNYLVLIGQERILHDLYGRLICPPAVVAEMCHPGAPPAVRHWALHTPGWLEIRKPSMENPSLDALGDGEREAICLALELSADLLLIDERAGRLQAVQQGLAVAGTLAVLEEAAQLGLIDFRSTLAAIREAGFRVSADVAAEFLKRNP